jgi:hypothetical protein
MTYAPELIHPKDGGYVFGAAPPSATHHGQCDGQTQLGSALRTVNCTGHGVYEIEADWLFGGPTASGWFSMCAADSKCDKMQFLFSFNNGAVRKPGVTVTWNNAKSMDRSVCPTRTDTSFAAGTCSRRTRARRSSRSTGSARSFGSTSTSDSCSIRQTLRSPRSALKRTSSCGPSASLHSRQPRRGSSGACAFLPFPTAPLSQCKLILCVK